MREVAIIGIGQTPVGEHWEKSLREIAVESVIDELDDAGRDKVDGIFVGNMMSGILSRQENLGTLIADWGGLRGVEAFKADAACGPGVAAVHLSVMTIASRCMDSVLVMGAEKITETSMAETIAALATAADNDFEGDHRRPHLESCVTGHESRAGLTTCPA